MRSRVRARWGFASFVPARGSVPPGVKMARASALKTSAVAAASICSREPRGHREPVASVVDRRRQAPRERQLAVRRVRLAPARYAAGNSQRARQHAAVGDLAQPAPTHRFDRCARGGAAAAAEVADRITRRVVDQPERVAADAGHVRVDDAQRRGGGDRRIDRRPPGLQDLHARGGRERMRAADDAPRGHRHRAAGLDHAAPVFGYEAERDAVVAVAQPGRLRTVVEEMALVAAAADAVVLGARIDQLEVALGAERAGNQREKARPAGAALVLHRRGEERQAAADADEHAGTLLAIQRARARALGPFIAEHVVLLRGKDLPPLVVRALERLGRERHVRALSEQHLPVALQRFDAFHVGRGGAREKRRGEQGRSGEYLQQRAAVHRQLLCVRTGLRRRPGATLTPVV